MTQYKVAAQTAPSSIGPGEAQLSAEVLGEAYGKIYDTFEEADAVALELLRSNDMYQTVTYYATEA